MPPLRPYTPLPMHKRVILRDPDAAPDPVTDAFGQVVSQDAWGTTVWANVRDIAPFVDLEEGVEIIRGGRKVITIRWRRNLSQKLEVLILPDRETVYRAVGIPIERGGPNAAQFTRYLEITVEQRDLGATQ